MTVNCLVMKISANSRYAAYLDHQWQQLFGIVLQQSGVALKQKDDHEGYF